ncbi:MAG: hypothetical protein ACK55I_37640, partial [bacterium]
MTSLGRLDGEAGGGGRELHAGGAGAHDHVVVARQRRVVMRGEGPLKHRLQRRGTIEEEVNCFADVLAGLRLPLRLLSGRRDGKIGLRHGRG